ncbi:MAG: hypothetical protein K8S99_14775 [Planctomycetes bacterium]|nr:hypothetical protein [Planctomycetota bacterium]
MRKQPKHSKKRVSVEVEFVGDGSVARIGRGGFGGGVPVPRPGRSLRFTVDREHRGRNGVWNPKDHTPTVRGGFQVNVYGTSRGYRALAQYLLALAEIDSSQDKGYHEHVEALSSDGRTRFHFILRKKR